MDLKEILILAIVFEGGIVVLSNVSLTSLPEVLFREPHNIVEGSVIWLYCEVNSTSSILSVTWNKDGGPLVQDVPHIRLKTFSSSSSTNLLLVIDNVVSSDAGLYQCTAKNGLEIANGNVFNMTVSSRNTPGMLRIVSQNNLATGFNGNRTAASDGDRISLFFTAGHVGDNISNYSTPNVQWLKDGKPADTLPSNTIVGFNGQLHSTLSFTFTVSAAGVYQCIFTDQSSHLFGSFPLRIDTGNFTVPERVSPEVVFHNIPNKLVLEVSGKGGYTSIIWSIRQVALGTKEAPAEVNEFVNFFEIFVREPTSIVDHGIYDITYGGTGGIGEEIAVVSYVMPNTTRQTEDASILEGSNLNITCTSTGGPVPSITWTVDNSTTDFTQTDSIYEATLISEVVTIGNVTSTLHIVNAQFPTHDGVYTCTGTNAVSGSYYSNNVQIKVQVQVIPEVAVTINGSSGINSRAVTLLCIVVRGNPTNYSYTWTFNNGTQSIDLDNPSSILLIKNFLFEQPQSYFCSATNEVGTGTGGLTLTSEPSKFTINSTEDITEYTSGNTAEDSTKRRSSGLAIGLSISLTLMITTVSIIISAFVIIIVNFFRKKKIAQSNDDKVKPADCHQYECVDKAIEKSKQEERDFSLTTCEAYGQLKGTVSTTTDF